MNLKSYIGTIPDFPKEGIVFRDIMPLLADPGAFAHSIDLIVEQWKGKVDAIAALEARGFLFGVPVALALGVPFVAVRKKGKLPGSTIKISYDLEYGSDTIAIQSGRIASGARVLLVDDLLATGGTAAAACALIAKAGGRVAGAAFVIELVDLCGRDKLPGVPIQSLLTY